MKVKVIHSIFAKTLQDLVNEFLEDNIVDVVEMKYSSTIFEYSVMIVYKEI